MNKTVFWSWQSDLSSALTKDFIKGALVQAIDTVAQELGLESAERLEIDHDTKGEAGLVEIVTTIFNKIDNCQVFVADITPVAEIKTNTSTKKVPNPNVMIELGYALREVGHRRVITVSNLMFGGKPEELPFDLRHRRGAITYMLADINDPSKDKVRKGLVKELVNALKTNLAAPREEQIIRNPLPLISIERGDEMPDILSIRQDVQLNDVPTLSEIMDRTPIKTQADQNAAASPFEGIGSFDIFSRQRTKPFREWTKEELDGYNKKVKGYYKRYEHYLEELKEYKLLRQRTVLMHLNVVNDGTKPATDVRGTITFPEGLLIYENDELPHPPVKPEPPTFAPHGFTSVMGQVVSQHAKFLLDPPRISDDYKRLTIRSKKIQQAHMICVTPFTVVMLSKKDIRSFSIRYQVGADEMPRQATGELHFKVELVNS